MVPGLLYVPEWLEPNACDSLLKKIDAADWSTQLKRRVQHYGHQYDYGRRSVTADAQAAPPIPQWLQPLAKRLARECVLDREADQAIINEYQPGQGISAHLDCVPCFGAVVAAISLGSSCVMDFTAPEHDEKVEVLLAPGSLCVMTGAARFKWRHAIPARKSDPGSEGRIPRGRRVSVTFRTVLGP